jgi:D-sedoheptulose 7-phosphate isomerase
MLGCDLEVEFYFDRLQAVLKSLDTSAVIRLGDELYERWRNERYVFIFGNGGSATTASHLAEDLGKTCVPQDSTDSAGTLRLKVLSLTDNVGWITALANDNGYESIFSEQLKHYASPGDLVIAISGSGNSPNVLRAVDWAKSQSIMTFALTGYDGGELKQIADDCIHVPLPDMGMVETVHLALGHWLVGDLAARVNKIGRYRSAATASAIGTMRIP